MLGKPDRVNSTSLLLMFLLISLQVAPCTLSLSEESINDEKIVVLTVIEQLASVVKEVGGERVKVESIIPSNVDPHHYEPSLDIIIKTLSQADIIVTTAQHHFPVEEKIHQIVSEGLIKVRVLSISDYEKTGLRLLRNPKTNDFNIHGFHLSIGGLRAIALAVVEELAIIDKVNSLYYYERLNTYLGNLEKIERTISLLLKDKRGIKVLLYTPLLQYVVEDLGLGITSIVVSELDVEPTEKDVSEMLRSLGGGEADYMLISDIEVSQNPKLIELLDRQSLPYVIVPLSRFTETPQLVSLSTAVLISSYIPTSSESLMGFSHYSLLLIFSIIANVIFLIIIILLVIKEKKHHGE
ncbi:MAG: zinc ABC transporter substrate-binding protein [Nitrososphaerota archaeon]